MATKIHLNYPSWLEKILKLLISNGYKNSLKLSTMIRENFKITNFKWLKIHLNQPPWLENILKLPWIGNDLSTKRLKKLNYRNSL